MAELFIQKEVNTMSDGQKIRKVVVPVAGLGTRLLPATKSQPKEMLPVGRKPVVQYVVEEMVEQGLRDLLLVTGSTKRSIENHLDTDPMLIDRLLLSENDDLLREVDFELQGAQIFYTRQRVPQGMKKPAGLGDAIKHGRAFVGDENFMVALGDTIIRSNGEQELLKRLIATHLDNEAAATIAVWKVEKEATRRYGIISPTDGADPELGEPFKIADIVEKPHPDEAPSQFAVAARYVFSPKIFDALDKTLPGHGGEVQLTDAIRRLVREGEPVFCVPLKPYETRYDIGNPESYFKAFIDFAFADTSCGEKIRNHAKKLLTLHEQGAVKS